AARAHVIENQATLAAAQHTFSPAAIANYVEAPQGGNAGETIAQRLFTIGAQISSADYVARLPTVAGAEAGVRQAQLDELAAERTERIKVVNLYYDALRAIAAHDIRAQALQQALSDKSAAQKRFSAGDSPRLDVIRADVAIAQAQSDSQSARVARENAIEALAVETAMSSSAFQSLAAFPQTSRSGLTGSLVDRALSQRSDIASARAAVLAQQALVATARRAGLPAVVATVGYTGGVDTGVLVHGPTATVQVLFPLSHAAADRASAENARLVQSQLHVESLVRQVSLDVSAAARTYAAAQSSVEAARRATTGAQAELRATETGYRNGAASSLDVADARRTYVQAQLNELNALYDRVKAQAILEQEVGP
ncbi:MAG: TolC family protein, partial [Candidatus Eremiobacteraeota bacterium]|nr:TolC family protein [Candidatus Eremiobacteraeota bacterium]